MRLIKNTANVPVSTNFRGHQIDIKPKGKLTINDSDENALVAYLLQTYGFLKDITPAPGVKVETVEVKEPNQKGKMVKKVKKVVRKAVSKRGK